MGDAERIPIDIDYEVAAEAAASDPRTTVREDGTLVIDILAPQPCAPEPATGEEIVVCAATDEASRYLPGDLTPPPEQTLADKVGEALYVKVGPVELGSIPGGDGTRVFGARVRF